MGDWYMVLNIDDNSWLVELVGQVWYGQCVVVEMDICFGFGCLLYICVDFFLMVGCYDCFDFG